MTIGTVGKTVDGREIKEQDIIDAADTYNKKLYTASINRDHYNFFGHFGTVENVRVGKSDVTDTKTLEAVLDVNSQFIELNRSGHCPFPSMELYPNFRGDGKTYLYGLAGVYKPASVATDIFKFASNECALLIPANFDFKLDFSTLDSDDEKVNFFSQMKNLFSSNQPKRQEEFFTDKNEQKENTMKKEEMEQLSSLIGESIKSAISESFSKKEKENENNNKNIEADKEFKELKEKVQTLSNILEKKPAEGTYLPENTGKPQEVFV